MLYCCTQALGQPETNNTFCLLVVHEIKILPEESCSCLRNLLFPRGVPKLCQKVSCHSAHNLLLEAHMPPTPTPNLEKWLHFSSFLKWKLLMPMWPGEALLSRFSHRWRSCGSQRAGRKHKLHPCANVWMEARQQQRRRVKGIELGGLTL